LLLQSFFNILFNLTRKDRKVTKNPAHFSNEREKVSVNDSKEKKDKSYDVRKFE